jgi:nucleosome binding factor SPN SPT16 subunit
MIYLPNKQSVIFECMARLPIDTLTIVKRLQEAGFALPQAEAQVQVLLDLIALQESATKTDIRKLRILSKKDIRETESKLRKEIQETEAKLRKEIQETEKRLEAKIQETEKRFQLQLQETEARIRTDIYRSQARVVFWVAGLIAAQIPIFYFLQHYLN